MPVLAAKLYSNAGGLGMVEKNGKFQPLSESLDVNIYQSIRYTLAIARSKAFTI
jgi:hypothetical protein